MVNLYKRSSYVTRQRSDFVILDATSVSTIIDTFHKSTEERASTATMHPNPRNYNEHVTVFGPPSWTNRDCITYVNRITLRFSFIWVSSNQISLYTVSDYLSRTHITRLSVLSIDWSQKEINVLHFFTNEVSLLTRVRGDSHQCLGVCKKVWILLVSVSRVTNFPLTLIILSQHFTVELYAPIITR